MRTKVCSKCKIRKDITEYSFKNKARDVRRADCKDCFSLLTQAHYQKHKSNYANKGQERRKESRNFILEYLKDKECIDCKNNDIRVLEFDHIQNKKCGISVLVLRGYSIKAIQEELDKCVVRCANCHAIKTSKSDNSYKYVRWKELNSVS